VIAAVAARETVRELATDPAVVVEPVPDSAASPVTLEPPADFRISMAATEYDTPADGDVSPIVVVAPVRVACAAYCDELVALWALRSSTPEDAQVVAPVTPFQSPSATSPRLPEDPDRLTVPDALAFEVAVFGVAARL
jgi:hypothetical protein